MGSNHVKELMESLFPCDGIALLDRKKGGIGDIIGNEG
jgi:hypothetical protein